MRGVVKLSAISAPLVVPWNQIDAKRKLQLCAMSIVHVDVGWVTESLPRNDAYALIIVKLFFIKFLGHATLVRRPPHLPHLLLRPWSITLNYVTAAFRGCEFATVQYVSGCE